MHIVTSNTMTKIWTGPLWQKKISCNIMHNSTLLVYKLEPGKAKFWPTFPHLTSMMEDDFQNKAEDYQIMHYNYHHGYNVTIIQCRASQLASVIGL